MQVFWFTLVCSSSLVREDSCIPPASRATASCQTWPKSLHMNWSELNSGQCAGDAQLSSKFLIKALTQSSQKSLEEAHWCQDSLCLDQKDEERNNTKEQGNEKIKTSSSKLLWLLWCKARLCFVSNTPYIIWDLYFGPKTSSFPLQPFLLFQVNLLSAKILLKPKKRLTNRTWTFCSRMTPERKPLDSITIIVWLIQTRTRCANVGQ